MSSWAAPVERLLGQLISGNFLVPFCFVSFTTFLFFLIAGRVILPFTVCYRKIFFLVMSAMMGLHFVDYKCRGTGQKIQHS